MWSFPLVILYLFDNLFLLNNAETAFMWQEGIIIGAQRSIQGLLLGDLDGQIRRNGYL